MLFALAPVFAQGDALPMTRIERDPAAAGMAGASMASTSSSSAAWSAFRNGALLPFARMECFSAGANYQIWSPDLAKTTHINVGAAYKLSDRFGFSLGFASQSGEAYDVFNADGTPAGCYYPKDMILAFGAGFAVTDQLSVGVNARYARQNLSDDVSYNGTSGDLYILYRPAEALNLTAGVSTLGTKITSASGNSFSQPASVMLAGSYGLDLLDGTFSVEPNLAADYYFSGNWAAAAGAELGFKNIVFARAGYRLASKEAVIPSHASVGVGLQLKGVRLDAAWLTASKALGNTLTLSLGYSF